MIQVPLLRGVDLPRIDEYLDDVLKELSNELEPHDGQISITPPPTEASDPRDKGEGCNVFRLVGNMWELRFGDERGNFSDRKGLQFIARLLRFPNPARPTSALELAGDSRKNVERDPSFQAVLDPTAHTDIKNQLEDIDELIADARRNNDEGGIQRHTAERQRILDELSKAVGKAGRDRALGPKSPAKRAQAAVSQRVSEVIKEVGKSMPKLGEHLKASIQTGTECAYRPATTVPWNFDEKTVR